MNLSFALNLPTSKTGAAIAPSSPESLESAVSQEFSALLGAIVPLAADGQSPAAEITAAEPGNDLPEQSGNFLPVVAAQGLPVAEGESETADIALLQIPALPHITAPAAENVLAGRVPQQTVGTSLPALPGKTEAAAAPLPDHPAASAAAATQTAAETEQAPVRQTAQAKPQAAFALDLDQIQTSQAASASLRQPTTHALEPRQPQTLVQADVQRTAVLPSAAVVAQSDSNEVMPAADEVAARKLMPLSAMMQAKGAPAAPAAPAAQTSQTGETGEAEAELAARPAREGEAARPAQPAREADSARTPSLKAHSDQTDTAQVAAKAAPAPASSAQQLAPSAVPTAVDAPRPAALANAAPDAVMAARHDFSAVVDRLTEAREQARPGRADMHLTHREFGNVSVQFEMAGRSLKVAMTSDDGAFAPAVQAALAERPIAAVAESGRSENQTARQDTSSQQHGSQSSSQNMSQGSGQTDAQRQEQQSRAAQDRSQGDRSQRPSSEGSQQSARAQHGVRDGDLFA